VIFYLPDYKAISNTMQHQKSHEQTEACYQRENSNIYHCLKSLVLLNNYLVS